MSSVLERGPDRPVKCLLCSVDFSDRRRYDSHLARRGPCREMLQRKRKQRAPTQRASGLGREGTDVDPGGGDGEDFGADKEAPDRSRRRLASAAATEHMGT